MDTPDHMPMNPPADPSSGAETAAPAPPQAGFLHVVFHGLFCFFERERDILVRVPRVMGMDSPGSDHVYLAGNWLGEMTYGPGEYELKGVHLGYGRFPRKRNLVIIGGMPAANPGPALYAQMNFPYPDQIASIQRVGVNPAAVFAGNSSSRVQQVKEIATLQVFTYRFDDIMKLSLDGHPWNAKDTVRDTEVGGFCALHLFAEPDRKMSSGPNGHVSHAFPEAMKMFDSIDLQMVRTDIVKKVKVAEVPFGTLVDEMEDYSVRLARFEDAVGVARKLGNNLNEIWKPNAARYGGDMERCGHSVGVSSES
jgi:hypothetical protein